MKRMLTLMLLLAIFCGSLVGCGETPEDVAKEEATSATAAKTDDSKSSDYDGSTQTYDRFGILCEVPDSWEKRDVNGENDYFYPKTNSGVVFLMIAHSDIGGSILEDRLMDQYAKGMEGSLTNSIRTKCEVEKNEAGYQYASINLKGEMQGTSGVFWNAVFDADNGITALGMFQQDGSDKDFKDDFFKLVDTVRLAEQTDVPPVDSQTKEPEPEPTQPATEPEDTETMGQKNALSKSQSYLSLMGFSYSGLIEQLQYEGFTLEESTYAADKCGADWNEQAAKKAQSYLDIMSFSRSGLIEQLEYEGFTTEQAEYGATAVGY